MSDVEPPEDIPDSVVVEPGGQGHPAELPAARDWERLYPAAVAFARATPWQLWSDTDRLPLSVHLDGRGVSRYDLIVHGGHGLPAGLVALPVPPAAGAIVLWLDRVGQVPAEHRARADRYGWPDDAALVPFVARVGAQGPGDLDATAARHLTLALTAVVAHRGPRRSDCTSGTVAFADEARWRYTIGDAPARDTRRRPTPPLELPAPTGPRQTVRLRVTVTGVTPAVVRVVDLPAAATLAELHDVLQVAIGWTDTHLHAFETPDGRRYAPADDGGDDQARDELTLTLRDVPARFVYRYDVGDGWRHDVERLDRGAGQPGCVQGQGACPPEDCGGVLGYARLRQALADPTHPDHDQVRGRTSGWSPVWTEADRQEADALVRGTVGQVPASVRLLLDVIGAQVRLTPGGRLPRVLVRKVQDQRPRWSLSGRPAHVEEDLGPLAALDDLLRRAGLLRLARGVLTPTKAATDDLQIVRRLRRTVAADSFDDIVTGVAVAHLAARGPLPLTELAALTHPWVEDWSIRGHPVTPHDVDVRLSTLLDRLEGLDLVRHERLIWHPGTSAGTLLPRATALAHLFRRERRTGSGVEPLA